MPISPASNNRSADRVMELLAFGVPLSLLMDLADPPILQPEGLYVDLTATVNPRLSRAEPA